MRYMRSNWLQSGMGCRQNFETRIGIRKMPKLRYLVHMNFLDGPSASTAENNAEVFALHFDKLYGCSAVYDDSVRLSILERLHAEGLGGVPTDSEISLAR